MKTIKKVIAWIVSTMFAISAIGYFVLGGELNIEIIIWIGIGILAIYIQFGSWLK